MSGDQLPEACSRFVDAARRQGIEPAVQRFPDGTRTAAEAAAAVGCEVGQIVKSLVFMAPDEPVLVLTSGANRVDEHKVADCLGVARIEKATADQVRAATGFAIGGTPPIGLGQALITVLDRDLLAYDEVWAAAGTPDTCFPIDPEALRLATGAVVVEVAP